MHDDELDRKTVPRLRTIAPPQIRYVDDEAPTLRRDALDEASARAVLLALDDPTLKRPALRASDAAALLDTTPSTTRWPPTLAPTTVDATLERFVASAPAPDESWSEQTSLSPTVRARRVQAIGRRAVAAALGLATLVVLAALVRIATRPAPASALGEDVVRAASAADTTGVLVPPASASGSTVYVDDVAAGVAPSALTVRCGVRTVRIGAQGASRAIDVPCAGKIEL